MDRFDEIVDGILSGSVDEGRIGRIGAGIALGAALMSSPADSSELAPVVKAIAKIESNNNPKAVGDSGRAFGILQIHPEVVSDYNRWTRSSLRHEDMFDPAIAARVCAKYLAVYGSAYERQTGLKPTPAILARIWNGGPSGWKKSATDGYAERFKASYR